MSLEPKIVNEDSMLCYPAIFDGAGKWAYSDDAEDKPITVSSRGLEELLRLVHDCWPIVAGTMLGDADKRGVYAKDLQPDNLATIMNRISAVWCEGDLVVSGLFIDPADGKVLVNKTGDDEDDASAAE